MKRFSSGKFIYFLAVVCVLIVAVAVYTQQKTEKTADKQMPHEDCPLMKKGASSTAKMETDGLSNRSDHHEMVMKNGEMEMGFSQTETTHHFLIMKDGGAIQVEANDANDMENRDKIRNHLKEIARQFKNGIFTTPFAVHGQIPAGVPVMDQLKNEIQYAYEETEKGARVRISTANSQALAAIHEFLKFQIEEHQTGDQINTGN